MWSLINVRREPARSNNKRITYSFGLVRLSKHVCPGGIRELQCEGEGHVRATNLIQHERQILGAENARAEMRLLGGDDVVQQRHLQRIDGG